MTLSAVTNTKPDTISIAGVDVELINSPHTELIPLAAPDYEAPAILKDVLLDTMECRPIILTGHTGAGKSSLFCYLANLLRQTLVRVNLNDQMTVGDFVGTYILQNQETVWVDGFLVKAMREGWWITLEEIDFAPSEILVYLNTLTEDPANGYLILKEKGFEVVRPHPNFRIFATANTVGKMSKWSHLYPGARKMNEAFLNRFQIYMVNYLNEEQESKVVFALLKSFNLKRNNGNQTKDDASLLAVATYFTKVAATMRSNFENDLVSCTFSTRRVLDWVRGFVRHKSAYQGAEASLGATMSDEDLKIFHAAIKDIFPPKIADKPNK